MSRRQKIRTNFPLAIFATLLIVGGVVLVTYVASQTPSAPSIASPALTAQHATSTSQAFLVVSAEGSRIVTGDVSTPFHFPDDAAKLGAPLSTLEGVRVSSGERVVLDADAHVVLASDALRSPDGRRTLAAAPFRKDGVGTVFVRYGKETQELVLRLPDGTPIRSAIPVGWWDERTAAVTGVVTSTRAVFAVSITGSIERVAFLPDEFDHLSIERGAAWYTTETPGPGLEAQPMPPATMERIGRDGAHTIVATENAGLILSYVMNASGMVAYAIALQDGGASRGAVVSDGNMQPVDGVPLLVLKDGAMLLRRQNGKEMSQIILVRVDGAEEVLSNLAGVPSDAAVFALDEIHRNP